MGVRHEVEQAVLLKRTPISNHKNHTIVSQRQTISSIYDFKELSNIKRVLGVCKLRSILCRFNIHAHVTYTLTFTAVLYIHWFSFLSMNSLSSWASFELIPKIDEKSSETFMFWINFGNGNLINTAEHCCIKDVFCMRGRSDFKLITTISWDQCCSRPLFSGNAKSHHMSWPLCKIACLSHHHVQSKAKVCRFS